MIPTLRPSALRKVGNGSLRILPFPEIDNKVRSGEYQFHVFGDCFVWTQVTQYPNERVLDVVLLLGDRWDALKADVVAGLDEFAKLHGCSAVEALSRRGLEHSLKPLGYKRHPKRVLLRKEL